MALRVHFRPRIRARLDGTISDPPVRDPSLTELEVAARRSNEGVAELRRTVHVFQAREYAGAKTVGTAKTILALDSIDANESDAFTLESDGRITCNVKGKAIVDVRNTIGSETTSAFATETAVEKDAGGTGSFATQAASPAHTYSPATT